MSRFAAGARAAALLMLFLPLGIRLAADDHFRTGGVTESEPFPGNPTKIDQRFHIQDANILGVQIHYNCHLGDTLNPGTLDFVIPAGVAMNWDATKTGVDAPVINWQNSGSAAGSRVAFNGYPNSKTMRFDVLSGFTPITDFFKLTNYGFSFPDPDLPAPGTFPKFADNFNLNANTVNIPFPLNHPDSAFVRLARPPSGFGLSAPLTLDAGPGPTAMTPVTLTESNTIGNGGIWAVTGIRINIPSTLNVTWHNPGVPVQATCSGTAVTAARIAANPPVSFLDGDKTVLIPVSDDFQPGESVTITGLSYANMGNDSTGSLRLNLGTSSAVTVAHAVDTNIIAIAGQPKISSFQNKLFTVGDPLTVIEDITVTESLGTPRINSVNDITIVMPTALANVASFASSTVTCTGTAVPGHVAAGPFVVNPNPGNKSITIPVAGVFGSGQFVKISGLRMTGFTGPLGSAQLGLDVNGSVGSFEGTDDKTIGIGRPTISSAIDQVFFVAPPPTQAMAQITIADDPVNPRIFPGTLIRIAIPTAPVFNMTWQGGPTAVTSSNLDPNVAYGPGNKVLIVTAGLTWTPGGTGTITGLNFTVGAASLPDNLELFMSATGTVTSLDDKFIAIGGIPTMSSGANPTFNQQFTVNDGSTLVNMITLTDAADPSFQTGNSLQIVIPASLHLEWNTGIAPTIGGTGALHITNPGLVFSYPDAKTLEIQINTTFGPGETLTLSNLEFTNFTAASAAVGLQVRVSVGGPVAATDNRTKAIGAPTISSLTNQVFGDTDLVMNAAQITITDDLTTPRIKPGTDLRVRIPSGFNMVWASTAPVLSGSAFTNGRVGTPTFAGRIMTIPVLFPFLGGETLIINGAQFTTFSGLSGLDNLELEVNNTGSVTPNAFDNRTIKIGTRPTIVGVSTLDTNRNGSIDLLNVRFSEAVNGLTTSVTQGTGFTLEGYSIAVGARDNADHTIVHFALVESGLPDTGGLPALTYVPASGNLSDVDDGLTLSATAAPTTVDRAAPVITHFTAIDSDGNGFLDQVVATFSENLAPGQSDINDWVLIDANGSTNLLTGLTNGNILINNNTVTIVLSNAIGTAGTPRYQYLDDGLGGALQDLAPAPNVVDVLTNNTVPVAQAGPDISAVPTKITLNGSASFDPDGQNLTFLWTQVPITTVALLNANSETPSFQTSLPGTYTFRLDVSDGLATSSDFITVTILNVTPTAVAVLNQVVQAGALVPLRGVQSTDINGDAISYGWSQSFGPPRPLSDPNIENPTFTPTVAGVYEYELTVKDTAGNTSPRSRVRITANSGGNIVPFADAGPDQVVTSGTLVTLNAGLSSTGLNPATYTWSSSFLASPVTTAVTTLTFTPPVPGTYTFTLVVHDTIANLDSYPDTVNVLVFDPANRPPTAVATKLAPVGTPLIGEVVTLDGTGSFDPEGAPLNFAWTQTAGPRVFFKNPNGPFPEFTPILAGSYEFQLVVTDGVHVSPPTLVRMAIKPDLPYVVPVATPSFTAAVGIDGVTGHVKDTGGAVNLISTRTPGTITWWWEQTAGPNVELTPSPLPFDTDPSFTPTVSGLYRFRLTATDHTGGMVNRGFMEVSTIDIVVDNAANAAPVADAGPNQNSILTGQTVTLTAQNSTDDFSSFGAGLTPFWKQVFGPPVPLSDPFAVQPTFVPTSAGIYVFELVVDDGVSSTKPAVTQVVVTEAPAVGNGSSGGGGSCGLSGLEPLVLVLLLAGLRRRRSV